MQIIWAGDRWTDKQASGFNYMEDGDDAGGGAATRLVAEVNVVDVL